jgi:nitrate reductase gamma subunit
MNTLIYTRIVIVVAMAVFLIGVYKNLIKKIIDITQAQKSDKDYAGNNSVFPLIRRAVDEVILQRRISVRSRLLWIRHLMIFGGFVTFFVIEFIIGIAKNYQGLGFIRQMLKFGLDVAGGVLILGLAIAVVHRIIYRKEEKGLTDLTSLILIFAVVISGLLSSACRTLLNSENFHAAKPLAEYLAIRLSGLLSFPLEDFHYWLFLGHITIAAAVIAYIPYCKLVHMLATPIGRMVTMGEEYADRKKTKVSEGLL